MREIETFQDRTDEELAVTAKEGCTEAEEELIRRWKNAVKAKANLYFIKGADREDLVQEGMIGVVKAIRGFDPEREISFGTFANLCINRQIQTAVKVAARKKHLPLNTSLSLSGPAGGESESTLEELLSSGGQFDPEELYLIKEAVGYLKDRKSGRFSDLELQVWELYMQGKTYGEIGVIAGKTAKAVDNAIQRTKKKLKACIEGR